MKRIAQLLGIMVAILVAAALVLPFVIDANQFRPRLETELTKALGREVKLGDLKLSLFSGGVTAADLSIADDPAFNKFQFISAKALKVGVELQPLIFSRKLNVTGIEIDRPDIALIQSAAGAWNFSSLGGTSAAAPVPKEPAGAGGALDLSVKLFKITDGRFSFRQAGDPQPKVLDKVNIEVKDFAVGSAFPFSLSAEVQGGGTLKLDGKAGPIDQTDTARTPFDLNLNVSKLDMLHSGLVHEASGFAGMVSLDGGVSSNGREVQLHGDIKAEQLKLAKQGTPAHETVAFDFTLRHETEKRSGALTRGDIHIGKAVAALTGTYRVEGTSTIVDMKVAAPAMEAGELTALLPSMAIVLPRGSTLQGGTAMANFTVKGPTEKLVIDGGLGLKNTRLAGFDLGSKMSTVATIAGLKVGPNTDFENLSADVHVNPEGMRVENISVIAKDIGQLSGAGTVSPANALDFKMRAKLQPSGGVLAAVGGNVPFLVVGTSSEPKFQPDIKGMAAGMAADKLGTLKDTEAGKAATGILNLFGRKKQN